MTQILHIPKIIFGVSRRTLTKTWMQAYKISLFLTAKLKSKNFLYKSNIKLPAYVDFRERMDGVAHCDQSRHMTISMHLQNAFVNNK